MQAPCSTNIQGETAVQTSKVGNDDEKYKEPIDRSKRDEGEAERDDYSCMTGVTTIKASNTTKNPKDTDTATTTLSATDGNKNIGKVRRWCFIIFVFCLQQSFDSSFFRIH